MDLLELLSDFSYIILALPLLRGLFAWKKLVESQRIIYLLVIITFINDSLTIHLNRQSQNNLWVYHFFVPLYFCVLVYLYRKSLNSLPVKSVLYWCIGLFLVFSTTNSLFIQPLDSFNTNAITTSMVFYIILTIIYFYQLLAESLYTELERNPVFWLSAGVLLYNSGALILFILANYFLEEQRQLVMSFWSLNIIFNILLIGFYTVALWVRPQT